MLLVVGLGLYVIGCLLVFWLLVDCCFCLMSDGVCFLLAVVCCVLLVVRCVLFVVC